MVKVSASGVRGGCCGEGLLHQECDEGAVSERRVLW